MIEVGLNFERSANHHRL